MLVEGNVQGEAAEAIREANADCPYKINNTATRGVPKAISFCEGIINCE